MYYLPAQISHIELDARSPRPHKWSSAIDVITHIVKKIRSVLQNGAQRLEKLGQQILDFLGEKGGKCPPCPPPPPPATCVHVRHCTSMASHKVLFHFTFYESEKVHVYMCTVLMCYVHVYVNAISC